MPIVDNWWQTELGWPAIALSRGLDKTLPIKPGSAGLPVPGWDVRVLKPEVAAESESEFFATRTEEQLREAGARSKSGNPHKLATRYGPTDSRHHSRISPHPVLHEAEPGQLGPVAIRLPLPPGSLLTLHNNETRFRKAYTDPHPGYFEVCGVQMHSSRLRRVIFSSLQTLYFNAFRTVHSFCIDEPHVLFLSADAMLHVRRPAMRDFTTTTDICTSCLVWMTYSMWQRIGCRRAQSRLQLQDTLPLPSAP